MNTLRHPTITHSGTYSDATTRPATDAEQRVTEALLAAATPAWAVTQHDGVWAIAGDRYVDAIVRITDSGLIDVHLEDVHSDRHDTHQDLDWAVAAIAAHMG